MSDANTLSASKINTTAALTATQTVSSAPVVTSSREATKDAGRVQVGGAAMHF
jgi:hypothetical protein